MENFKTIPGFDNYEVSTTGTIKSKERKVMRPYVGNSKDKTPVMKEYNYKEKILTPQIVSTNKGHEGYKQIMLKDNNGKKRFMYIHRLVAMTFIPNPENKLTVNHKDENKHNNTVENLEWMTKKENLNYGNRSQKQSESLKKYWENKKKEK